MTFVSICIATYRREERLAALLGDLTCQTLLPDEVIIVDNDASGSARRVCALRTAMGAPFPIRYEIQPLKNISLTRNKTVELAGGEWLAFLDDDERAPPPWLRQLMDCVRQSGADGVLGPVDPIVPTSAPTWIRRGRFYEFPRMRTGGVVPANRLRFGNVLLRGTLLRDAELRFDPAYGLTGGEDGDLLARLAQRGARIVWCDEAIVHEPVELGRLSLQWLLKRSMRGGQDLARHALQGRYGRKSWPALCAFFLRALLQALAAAGLALISLPMGRHVSALWLTKLWANAGKLSVLWGSQYREYA